MLMADAINLKLNTPQASWLLKDIANLKTWDLEIQRKWASYLTCLKNSQKQTRDLENR